MKSYIETLVRWAAAKAGGLPKRLANFKTTVATNFKTTAETGKLILQDAQPLIEQTPAAVPSKWWSKDARVSKTTEELEMAITEAVKATPGCEAFVGVMVERAIRRMWPHLMRARTLMVGCVAGEGHLDGDEACHRARAELLASTIAEHTRGLGAHLIVFKEFPARYRSTLDCLVGHGFTRIPSLPMTRLCIDYANFDDYMKRALNSATRKKLRKKFEATARAFPLELSIINDATPVIAQVYPLYLQVYKRSKLHFEKLTEQYFCGLGRRMGDKVRFFLWRQGDRIVAFTTCIVHGDAIYAEYIGLDYDVALDLHLYHFAFRDMVSWAIDNGYKWFCSSGLNYDPKLHLRHLLDPIDLYVRHTSAPINILLKKILPAIEPTRYDETLAKFRNYHELWAPY